MEDISFMDVATASGAGERDIAELVARYDQTLVTAKEEKLEERAQVLGFTHLDAEKLQEEFRQEVRTNPLYSQSQLSTSSPYDVSLSKNRFSRIVTWQDRGPADASIIKAADPPFNIGDFTVWNLVDKVTAKKLLQAVQRPFLLLVSKATSKQLKARSNHKTRASRKKPPANRHLPHGNVAPAPPISTFLVQDPPTSTDMSDQQMGELMVSLINKGYTYVQLVALYREVPRILLYLAQNGKILRNLEEVIRGL